MILISGTWPAEDCRVLKSGIPSTEEDVQRYKAVAESLNLAITGGSDYHGGNTGEILMGKIKLPYTYVEKLKGLLYK